MRSPTANRRLVERWNARYPVSTRVIYWPALGRSDFIVSATRDLARMLGDAAVVPIDARPGVVSLWHCKPVAFGPLGTTREVSQ